MAAGCATALESIPTVHFGNRFDDRIRSAPLIFLIRYNDIVEIMSTPGKVLRKRFPATDQGTRSRLIRDRSINHWRVTPMLRME